MKREGVGAVLNNAVSGGQEMKGNNVVIIIINTSYRCFINPTFFEDEYLLNKKILGYLYLELDDDEQIQTTNCKLNTYFLHHNLFP